MVTAVQVIKYRASNGVVYDTRDQAEEVDFVIKATKALQLTGLTSAEVMSEVFKNRATIIMWLEEANKSFNLEIKEDDVFEKTY